MKQSFAISAEVRTMHGKGASRRLRREGKVPAIIYGGTENPQAIQVSANELMKSLKHEAFYSAILNVEIAGKAEKAVLKDLHRHPVRNDVMHMDLQRVLANVLLRMHIPLHFKGGDVAPGVKVGGGVVEHQQIQVEVECLPKDLPEFIEVDLSELNLNEAVHLSQLALGEGVQFVELKHGNDVSVAAVHLPRLPTAEEVAEDAAKAAAATPAAVGKAKAAAKAPAAPAAATKAAPAKKK
ncbi:50S ribosomal protein L25/general stress protein Ctc [Nevskia sp.]|uniref:50S ribosomal protein L25/general stress protein Ctc n=1 Tax=Nevskia sp. TaxID=1929292 RepID=UPI0025FD2377|nr:50S ribosomal protein L25/general stress protein Ctc [Nevskia sp.]